MDIIDLDYSKIELLKTTLTDNNYIEYICHRYHEDKSIKYDEWSPDEPAWVIPDDWLSRYHLYFEQYKHLLQSATIFDIGANLNFYNTWAVLNGAKSVDYIEPDEHRFKYGKEYLSLRNVDNAITGQCMNIESYMKQSMHKQYDIVFLLDVLYYTNNHMEIFKFIKDVLNPKYVFFECTVREDLVKYPYGHIALWYPDTTPVKPKNLRDNVSEKKLAMYPTRKALYNMISAAGLTIDSMYDYKDYKYSNGPSYPRRNHKKIFMILSQNKLSKHLTNNQ